MERERLRALLEQGGGSGDDLARFDAAFSRRGFLAAAVLAGMGAGADAAVRGLFGRGLLPIAWAAEEERVAGKPGMIVHVDLPLNGEFPPHLLDDDVTPTERHFVRNNGGIPKRARDRDPQGWKLIVDGEVQRRLELTLGDLKKLPHVSMPLLVECGGNGRGLFEPPVRGLPWSRGAVGCSRWGGARLRDVLEKAGLKDRAVYTAHYGEDPPLGTAPPFSRGVPIDKAMDPHTLVAWEMNGKDLDPRNGYPVRLVVPGWIGSCSQKWLTRITIRDRVHDSDKMTGYSYRVPAHPVAPGTRPPESEMVIATSWIVKSLITRPAEGAKLEWGATVEVAGHAWAGERSVSKVLVSKDYGISWSEAKVNPPPNRYSWARFSANVTFPKKGYYEIWARAFDDEGGAQPFRQPWNPRGYLGNVVHRVPVHVEA